MIEDAMSALNQSKSKFSQNVHDIFGKSILEEGYEPFSAELTGIRSAINSAHDEQKIIRNLLIAARAIVV